MNCLITGAAGFIGSHLCEALLTKGHRVTGIDVFSDNYDPVIKKRNLRQFVEHPNFILLEADLLAWDWSERLGEVDWVFHLAARPGVRTSWGEDFALYCRQNVLATQRLLELCLRLKPMKIVYASSSSVYGNAKDLPIKEDNELLPISPYGATKLAGEHLCRIYHTNHELPVCTLRYFTVYGPRQRPDMAFSIWIEALLNRAPVRIFGDGRQTRDFTFVGDAVRAAILAAERSEAGATYNIAGGSRATPRQVLEALGEISAVVPDISWEEMQKGDPRDTWADTTRAQKGLGFTAQTTLKDGLKQQYELAVQQASITR